MPHNKKTWDEFFNSESGKKCKTEMEKMEKELNDRLADRQDLIDYIYGIDEPEVSVECEVKLEKTPDPAKEEIFATCLNFLHTHTEDELYEIVRLAFKAAEVFGY